MEDERRSGPHVQQYAHDLLVDLGERPRGAGLLVRVRPHRAQRRRRVAPARQRAERLHFTASPRPRRLSRLHMTSWTCVLVGAMVTCRTGGPDRASLQGEHVIAPQGDSRGWHELSHPWSARRSRSAYVSGRTPSSLWNCVRKSATYMTASTRSPCAGGSGPGSGTRAGGCSPGGADANSDQRIANACQHSRARASACSLGHTA